MRGAEGGKRMGEVEIRDKSETPENPNDRKPGGGVGQDGLSLGEAQRGQRAQGSSPAEAQSAQGSAQAGGKQSDGWGFSSGVFVRLSDRASGGAGIPRNADIERRSQKR